MHLEYDRQKSMRLALEAGFSGKVTICRHPGR
jgi:hypothetical protein